MAEDQKVAAIVAAYNAENTIVAAVESLLAGTMPCRIFVVDDCSRKPVADVLQHVIDQIVVIRLEKNGGPAVARNAAIERIIADGFKYVLIQDADDVSRPTRVQRQFEFLEAHPEIGACGTWCREFHHDINEIEPVEELPTEPEDVRRAMFFNMAISHASAMIRTDALKRVGLYSDVYPVAEDYELFRRIGNQYELANLPEFLLHYRISPSGQSQSRRYRQIYDRFKIQLKYFDATQWRAWAGLGKSVLTFCIPRSIFYAIKFNVVRSRPV